MWQLCDATIGSTGWIGLLKKNLSVRKVQLAHRRLDAHSRSGRVLFFKEHCRRDVLEFSEEFDKYLIFETGEEMKRDDS